MRKIPLLLLAMGLRPVLAHAQIELDTSVKGFYFEVAGEGDLNERNKLIKSALSEIRDTARQLRVKADPAEVRQLNSDMKRLKAEHQLFVETEQKLYTSLSNEKNLTDLLQNAFTSKKESLENLAKIASDRANGLSSATGAVDPVVSEPLALANSPFKLVATVSLNEKNETVMKFSIDPKSFNTGVYSDAVKNVLSPSDQKSLLLEKIDKALKESDGVFLTPSSPAEAFETLTSGKFVSNLLNQQLLSSKQAKLKTALADAKSQVGDPRHPDPDSELGRKLDDLKEKTDNSEKEEALKELEAKRLIAEYLREHDPDPTDPCADIVKVVGEFSKLPKTAQRECDHLDPVKKAKKEAEEKKLAEADKKADEADAQKGMEQLSVAKQLCDGLVQERAAMTGIKAVSDLVDPLYAQLTSQGFNGSTLFGQLVGDTAILEGCLKAYQAMRALNPNGIIPNTCSTPDIGEKTASMVAGFAANDAEGNKKLEKELDALRKILSVSGNSLAALSGTSPLGLGDPMLAANPKVMAMQRNHMAAAALVDAITAELSNRRQANKSRLRPIGSGSGSGIGGVPVVGAPTGSGVGTGMARPMGNGVGVAPGGLRPADAARTLRMNSPQTTPNLMH